MDREKMNSRLADDERYMRRCIQLARFGEAGAAPNPMVGAVVVWKGKIIGEGYHRKCGGPHAEVNAIRSVKCAERLRESTIYVSLEPCAHYGKTPPCADLIVASGIPRVVVGCMDPFAKVNGLGIRKMRDAGVQVEVGVLENECLRLNERFITFHQKRRPWVTLKWAQSADGFIARKEGESVRFSTPRTMALMHRVRTRHQAIMVGTHTALWDNPSLTVREWVGKQPMRITIDTRDMLPAELHIMDGSVPTKVFKIGDLQNILTELHKEGVQSLLVEGGALLHKSFMEQGLWDEARVEVAPLLLGEGVPAVSLDDATLESEECYGENEVRYYRPKRKK